MERKVTEFLKMMDEILSYNLDDFYQPIETYNFNPRDPYPRKLVIS